jgi:GT2 family glycosyltransferase
MRTMTARIAVGIPTVGRAAVLCETLREFAHQTRQPDTIFICGAKQSDLEGVGAVSPDVVQLLSEAGLPRQRNAILAAAADADVVVFFDDDFLPHPQYLAEIESCMAGQSEVVVATGLVLADGIKGPGLSVEEGQAILGQANRGEPKIIASFSGYGCNMAIRMAPVNAHKIRFDERLPLYGWQEDVDFSRRLSVFGTVVCVTGAQGVHLGVKSGRNTGLRLGYSQVANPLYLSRKRQGYPLRRALSHIAKNMAMNVIRSFRPEAYVDRRGRLRGNFLAIRDLVTGHMVPERILEL